MQRGHKNLAEKIGRLFVWGFEGTSVSKSFRSFLHKYPPAGVILFKRNLESLHQTRWLTAELRKLCGPSLMIGIDEEGGRVTRLPDPFPRFPPMEEVGKIYEKTGDPDLIFQFGRFLGGQLISLGINTNFAPVLDVNSNPANPIIGNRAFSKNPRRAAKVAVAFFLGMAKAGVIACGKHFPGHGDTETDSHLTLPRVSRNKKILENVELQPFREAVKRQIPMLMTAHVVYNAWDAENPATLSKIILRDLLRVKMKFKGLVISDDLLMKAVSEKYSVAESAFFSLKAGVDLPLVCRGGEEGGEVLEEVAGMVAGEPGLIPGLEMGLGRLIWLRKKYLE